MSYRPIKNEIEAGRNALAPRGGLSFYSRENSSLKSTLLDHTVLTEPFSFYNVLVVPNSYISANRGIASLTSSATDCTQANAVVSYIDTSNNYRARIYGSTTSDYNEVSLSLTPWAGMVVHLALTRNGTTVAVYVNGAAQSVSTASAGTPPTWAGSVSATYFNLGFITNTTPWIGIMYSATLYNLDISSADVQEIFNLNGAVQEKYQWGTSEQIVAAVDRDMSGANNWIPFNTASVSVSGGKLQITGAASGYGARLESGYFQPGTIFLGRMGRLKVTISNSSSNSVRAFAYNNTIGGVGDYLVNVGNGTHVGTVQFTAALGIFGNIIFDVTSGSGQSFDVDDVSLKQVGAIAHFPLDDGLGLVASDASANGLHAIMYYYMSMSYVAPKVGPARIRRRSSTNGNEQLFGQECLPAFTNCHILRVRAKSRSGTPSVTLGTYSGGADVVTSVSLSTTWKNLTIALTNGITTGIYGVSLWAGSNSTDIVDWDISWEPLYPTVPY